MLTTHEQNARMKLTVTVIAIIVISGLVVVADHLRNNDEPETASVSTQTTAPVSQAPTTSTTTPTTTPAVSTSPSTDTATGTTNGINDGTYSASSTYYVPHGQENIEVSLTIKNGVIASSSIVNSENDRDSAAYQEAFTSQYKSYVVGKSISGLKLSVISGASDTTQGFNNALAQIANKAKA